MMETAIYRGKPIHFPREDAPWPLYSTPTATCHYFLLRLMLLLVLVFSAAVSITVLVRRGQTPPNPVMPYLAALGRPTARLEAEGYVCAALSSLPGMYLCDYTSAASPLRTVHALLAGDVAEQVVLVLSESTLRLGDLVLLWGPPVVDRHAHSVAFTWCDFHSYAQTRSATGRHLAYFAPIDRIMVTVSGLDECSPSALEGAARASSPSQRLLQTTYALKEDTANVQLLSDKDFRYCHNIFTTSC